jgi:rfaE bifunctional protein nucleotidyltransferase chain/domain
VIVVFTNGVFDVLHRGHVECLKAARALGDRLIVGINSDASAARLKPGRPIFSAEDRRAVLLALRCVDEVMIFDEADASECIRFRRPEVYVKAGYDMGKIPEAKVVLEYGGKLVAMPTLRGYSTTAILERLA